MSRTNDLRMISKEILDNEMEKDYHCHKCKDSGYLEKGAYCDCDYGIIESKALEEEHYECRKCKDTGNGVYTWSYCNCPIGRRKEEEEP